MAGTSEKGKTIRRVGKGDNGEGTTYKLVVSVDGPSKSSGKMWRTWLLSVGAFAANPNPIGRLYLLYTAISMTMDLCASLRYVHFDCII